MENNRLKQLLEELIKRRLVKNQLDFGNKVRKSRSYFTQVMNEKQPLTTQIAEEISSVFGVNIRWLLDGTGEMFSKTDYRTENNTYSTYEPSQKYGLDTYKDKYIELLERNVSDLEKREKEVIEREKVLLSSLVTQTAFQKLMIRTTAMEELTLHHLSALSKRPIKELLFELGTRETELTHRHIDAGILQGMGR